MTRLLPWLSLLFLSIWLLPWACEAGGPLTRAQRRALRVGMPLHAVLRAVGLPDERRHLETLAVLPRGQQETVDHVREVLIYTGHRRTPTTYVYLDNGRVWSVEQRTHDHKRRRHAP